VRRTANIRSWALVAVVAYALAPASVAQAAPADGAAITPDVARSVYERLAPLGESDGCRLVRFDTSRFQIDVGLQTAAQAERSLTISAAPRRDAQGRESGGWTLAAPADVERDCAATLAALRHILSETPAPRGESGDARAAPFASVVPSVARINRALLAASFVLLVLGVSHVLARQAKALRPPSSAVLALAILWMVGLALRLWLSPRTFLHEYYHVAETLLEYLEGDSKTLYGDTGPALFQLAGAMLGRPSDVQLIFLTNAILASLAVPAAALLDLAVVGNWARALLAAALLCVLPQHLRFSASEVTFVQSITFGMTATALFALYVRTRRLEDALCAALALSLAVQTRPEMLFFPAVPLLLLLLAEPRSWRVLFERRTLLALLVAGVLLVPRLVELLHVLGRDTSPPAALPDPHRYLHSLVLFQGDVTPPVYWLLLLVGLPFTLWRKPGLAVWATVVFVAYTTFSLSLYDNGPYNVRTQLLPVSFVVFVAAGAATAWTALWSKPRLAIRIGTGLLVALGALVIARWHGFVTELRDQQLEWAFLERTVPLLPERATLLTAAEIGGRDLDAFPELLLKHAGKSHRMVDVRRAAAGNADWPAPGEDLLYYQGMFCYFAFEDAPSPEPMTPFCRDVHERYVTEPLFVEDLHTQGYSRLRYTSPPYRIGFFRLKATR
jgi:hypothetical protein